MSRFQFVKPRRKYNSDWCRVSDCQWIGHITELAEHVEQYHPRQLRIIHSDSYFELSFEELQSTDPFLLCSNNGIYWFAQNSVQEGFFARGLFEVACAKRVKYCIKLGTFSTKIMQMHGPFQSQNGKSKRYDFNMQDDYMRYLATVMTPKVVIFFGEFQEDADEYGTCGMGEWPVDATPKNLGYPETFICAACTKLVAGIPLFCPKRHFLCEYCDRMVRSSECPRCDKNIFRDSQSEDIAFALFHTRYQSLVEVNGMLIAK